MESTGKGQSVPCKETGKSELWRFAAGTIDFTSRIYSPFESQVRQLESLIVSEVMAGAFPAISGRKNPLAKRPHFFLRIISFPFFWSFKRRAQSLQCEVGLYSHQINYSVSFKIPIGNACYVIANSHRSDMNVFSGNCLCNNKLLVGKWIGFSQAMHLIPFTLIVMEKFPVSLVGAAPVQGCGKLRGWICLSCKVSVLINFVPSGFRDLLWDLFEHIGTNL